jgi:hypothetical protein
LAELGPLAGLKSDRTEAMLLVQVVRVESELMVFRAFWHPVLTDEGMKGLVPGELADEDGEEVVEEVVAKGVHEGKGMQCYFRDDLKYKLTYERRLS